MIWTHSGKRKICLSDLNDYQTSPTCETTTSYFVTRISRGYGLALCAWCTVQYFLLTPAGSDTPVKPREDSWYASRSECRALSEPGPGGSVLESRSISYLYFPQRRSPHIGTVTFVILLLKWLRSSQSHWKRPSWKKPTHLHELYQCNLVVLQHLHYALDHSNAGV